MVDSQYMVTYGPEHTYLFDNRSLYLQWRTFAIQYSVVIDIVNIGIKILDTLKWFLVITRHFVFLNLRFCEYKSRER